jgi:hypothetical protein
MADDEKSLSSSLKSIFEKSNFIDSNNALLNAILEKGINGLNELQEEIAPKVFKHLESSIKQLLATNNKCKCDQIFFYY